MGENLDIEINKGFLSKMKLIFALFAGYNSQNVTDDSGDLGRRRKQPGGEKEVEITLEEGPGTNDAGKTFHGSYHNTQGGAYGSDTYEPAVTSQDYNNNYYNNDYYNNNYYNNGNYDGGNYDNGNYDSSNYNGNYQYDNNYGNYGDGAYDYGNNYNNGNQNAAVNSANGNADADAGADNKDKNSGKKDADKNKNKDNSEKTNKESNGDGDNTGNNAGVGGLAHSDFGAALENLEVNTFDDEKKAYGQPAYPVQKDPSYGGAYPAQSGAGDAGAAYGDVGYPVGGLTCWTCHANSFEECERFGREQKCMDNEESCELEIRERSHVRGQPRQILQIHMGCKQKMACSNNHSQNFQNENPDYTQCRPESQYLSSVCRQCCSEDLCTKSPDWWYPLTREEWAYTGEEEGYSAGSY